MRVAALDLGTNTFLLLVAEVEHGRIVEVLHDEVRVVRLGQGVHENRRFHADALKRARECLYDYSQTIRRLGAERTKACATSAARDVANGQDLIQIGASVGIPIDIISGEREAELTFLGTISEKDRGPVMIIDVGGGSTEYIFGAENKIIARKSLDIGSVRLTEMFVSEHPIPAIEMAKMTGYVQDQIRAIREIAPRELASRVIAVAGTPTTLATLDQGMPFESDRVHGYRLPLGRIRSWVQQLAGLTVEERQKLAGMEPKRADVLVAGALVLMVSAQSFQAAELEVSIRGLRYGLARAMGDGLA